MTFIHSATTRRYRRSGPTRTPLCWTQPFRVWQCHHLSPKVCRHLPPKITTWDFGVGGVAADGCLSFLQAR